MNKLKTNAGIYLISNIFVAGIPFLLMPFLTRALGPKEYGIVALFTTFISLLSPFVGLNTHNGLTKRWFDSEQFYMPDYMAACILILFASCGLSVFIIFIFNYYLASILSVDVFWIYMAAVLSGLYFIIQLRLVIWQVQEYAIYYGFFQIMFALINAGLSYIIVIYFIDNHEGRILAYTISLTLMGLSALMSIYKDGFIGKKIRWLYIKDAFSFGAPLIPHVVGALFLLMADRMIVNIKLGPEQTGIYMVAVQISLGFNLISESFNKAFIPKLYGILKKNQLSEKKYLVKLTYYCFFLLLMAPLISIFIGHYIVLFLAGDKYLKAAPVLNWLILAQSFHGMYYLVTSYLFYEGKTVITSLITICCGIFSVALTFYFVNIAGLIGAGISAAIGMLFQFILTWILAAKVHPMPWVSSFGIPKKLVIDIFR